MAIFLFSILSLFTIPDSPAGNTGSLEFVYDAYIGSRNIGQLSATRSQLSDSVVYLVTSDIDAQVGIRLVQDYRLESVYRNGFLTSSEIYNIVNEKVRADTRIRREGDSYLAIRGDSIILEQDPVDFSIVRLFFSEPAGTEYVFSENYAEELVCRPEKSDWLKKYCIVLPDRTKVFYYYDRGICEQFEVRLVLFNVRYRLRKVNSLP
jgi:hypothetical protein